MMPPAPCGMSAPVHAVDDSGEAMPEASPLGMLVGRIVDRLLLRQLTRRVVARLYRTALDPSVSPAERQAAATECVAIHGAARRLGILGTRGHG